MKKTLYVGNLSFDCSEDDLRNHMGQAVNIESAKLIYDRDSGRSRGFAFVDVASEEEMNKAIQEFSEQEFMDRKMIVREAYDNKDQRGGGGHRDRR